MAWKGREESCSNVEAASLLQRGSCMGATWRQLEEGVERHCNSVGAVLRQSGGGVAAVWGKRGKSVEAASITRSRRS